MADRTGGAVPDRLALTFDDGPHPDSTPALLAALAAAGHRATFFLCGAQAERHPELVRALDRAGMPLGNHSWSHPHLTALPPAEARDEIHRTNRILTELTGRPPTLFRPPYGDTSPAVRGFAAEAGLTEVLWDVDTRDWDGAPPAAIAAATAAARPGDTVLLHDHGNRNTVTALPAVLAALTARGLRCAPVAG
ncbi:polysaccharide deacetylase family protein [Streptomyces sp. TLI_171]|uniref:polysaccharide deacetylase family protein n=1 Tax=Streptomyces sp. TLI_171 TaxID=1938859 RepID=UPI000C19EF31|nr:polysaccharide deacetylase family protein [Streptomyces sp. TLI_171]RKE17741.1 peptidoglycan/xylan/chitin deacetylase (PgdA/CDA1 family) [Streptomyces sp. TLI_171]